MNPTLITSSGEGKPGFVESERFEREEEEAQAAVSAAEPGPAGAVVATAPEPEEKEEEKEVKKERGKEIPPEPKEPPKRKAAAKPETSPKHKNLCSLIVIVWFLKMIVSFWLEKCSYPLVFFQFRDVGSPHLAAKM